MERAPRKWLRAPDMSGLGVPVSAPAAYAVPGWGGVLRAPAPANYVPPAPGTTVAVADILSDGRVSPPILLVPVSPQSQAILRPAGVAPGAYAGAPQAYGAPALAAPAARSPWLSPSVASFSRPEPWPSPPFMRPDVGLSPAVSQPSAAPVGGGPRMYDAPAPGRAAATQSGRAAAATPLAATRAAATPLAAAGDAPGRTRRPPTASDFEIKNISSDELNRIILNELELLRSLKCEKFQGTVETPIQVDNPPALKVDTNSKTSTFLFPNFAKVDHKVGMVQQRNKAEPYKSLENNTATSRAPLKNIGTKIKENIIDFKNTQGCSGNEIARPVIMNDRFFILDPVLPAYSFIQTIYNSRLLDRDNSLMARTIQSATTPFIGVAPGSFSEYIPYGKVDIVVQNKDTLLVKYTNRDNSDINELENKARENKNIASYRMIYETDKETYERLLFLMRAFVTGFYSIHFSGDSKKYIIQDAYDPFKYHEAVPKINFSDKNKIISISATQLRLVQFGENFKPVKSSYAVLQSSDNNIFNNSYVKEVSCYSDTRRFYKNSFKDDIIQSDTFSLFVYNGVDLMEVVELDMTPPEGSERCVGDTVWKHNVVETFLPTPISLKIHLPGKIFPVNFRDTLIPLKEIKDYIIKWSKGIFENLKGSLYTSVLIEAIYSLIDDFNLNINFFSLVKEIFDEKTFICYHHANLLKKLGFENIIASSKSFDTTDNFIEDYKHKFNKYEDIYYIGTSESLSANDRFGMSGSGIATNCGIPNVIVFKRYAREPPDDRSRSAQDAHYLQFLRIVRPDLFPSAAYGMRKGYQATLGRFAYTNSPFWYAVTNTSILKEKFTSIAHYIGRDKIMIDAMARLPVPHNFEYGTKVTFYNPGNIYDFEHYHEESKNVFNDAYFTAKQLCQSEMARASAFTDEYFLPTFPALFQHEAWNTLVRTNIAFTRIAARASFSPAHALLMNDIDAMTVSAGSIKPPEVRAIRDVFAKRIESPFRFTLSGRYVVHPLTEFYRIFFTFIGARLSYFKDMKIAVNGDSVDVKISCDQHEVIDSNDKVDAILYWSIFPILKYCSSLVAVNSASTYKFVYASDSTICQAEIYDNAIVSNSNSVDYYMTIPAEYVDVVVRAVGIAKTSAPGLHRTRDYCEPMLVMVDAFRALPVCSLAALLDARHANAFALLGAHHFYVKVDNAHDFRKAQPDIAAIRRQLEGVIAQKLVDEGFVNYETLPKDPAVQKLIVSPHFILPAKEPPENKFVYVLNARLDETRTRVVLNARIGINNLANMTNLGIYRGPFFLPTTQSYDPKLLIDSRGIYMSPREFYFYGDLLWKVALWHNKKNILLADPDMRFDVMYVDHPINDYHAMYLDNKSPPSYLSTAEAVRYLAPPSTAPAAPPAPSVPAPSVPPAPASAPADPVLSGRGDSDDDGDNVNDDGDNVNDAGDDDGDAGDDDGDAGDDDGDAGVNDDGDAGVNDDGDNFYDAYETNAIDGL